MPNPLTPLVLPDIKDLVATATKLHDDIDRLHAGNNFANASQDLREARALVSTALGRLHSSAATIAAKTAKTAPAP